MGKWSIFVLTCRFINNSYGVLLVARCQDVVYSYRLEAYRMSLLGSWCFAIAAILLIWQFVDVFHLSLRFGMYGVTGLWMNSVLLVSCLNSWELNGGPLSVCSNMGHHALRIFSSISLEPVWLQSSEWILLPGSERIGPSIPWRILRWKTVQKNLVQRLPMVVVVWLSSSPIRYGSNLLLSGNWSMIVQYSRFECSSRETNACFGSFPLYL